MSGAGGSRAGDAAEAGAAPGGTSGGKAGSSGSSGAAAQGGTRGGTGGSAGAASSAGSGSGGESAAAGAAGAEADGGESSGGAPGEGGAGGAPCVREILDNGDFDAGTEGWTEESSDQTPVIFHRANSLLIGQGVGAHSPDYLVWLGGVEDRTARLWRSVELPAGAALVRLRGFYWVTTRESEPKAFDQAYIELVQGTTALALGHFTNLDPVTEWTAFETTIDARAFTEEPLTFQLRSEVDGSVVTNFFFDSLALTAEFSDCSTE